MHIAGRLHIRENVLLQLWNRLQRVRYVLILLNVANDFGRLRALGKVDEIGAFDQRGNTVFDECQICKIDALWVLVWWVRFLKGHRVPKKGIQGGFALCRVSRYSAKFFVLPMSLRMLSNVAIERWLTALQVLFRRWIGAVPRAEMMDVSVEKLFNCRHF